ncbi:unnamed protein product [Cylicostephanus goldi]|uniref:Peptidase M13 C-terminal domain-containing protein n=1 Tax=Cylicostephanus goldi TaxID=71465 RepID=A0A3P7N3B5_CYLGO|nr:unnamed protein product [Cylicostephanus goldi]
MRNFWTGRTVNRSQLYKIDLSDMTCLAGCKKAVNYGAIGSVVGHEITHGFDSDGRFYDAHGERRSWWNENTEKEFEQRSQCFIDQYGKIEVSRVYWQIVFLG